VVGAGTAGQVVAPAKQVVATRGQAVSARGQRVGDNGKIVGKTSSGIQRIRMIGFGPSPDVSMQMKHSVSFCSIW
jgi:hypothetical protein